MAQLGRYSLAGLLLLLSTRNFVIRGHVYLPRNSDQFCCCFWVNEAVLACNYETVIQEADFQIKKTLYIMERQLEYITLTTFHAEVRFGGSLRSAV